MRPFPPVSSHHAALDGGSPRIADEKRWTEFERESDRRTSAGSSYIRDFLFRHGIRVCTMPERASNDHSSGVNGQHTMFGFCSYHEY
jgi:hypothetical protein